MVKLVFSTTGAWTDTKGCFGCASLGLAGVCDNNEKITVSYPNELDGVVLTGTYDQILDDLRNCNANVHAAIVLFGNAGGENAFMRNIRQMLCVPTVGGGAAIDGATGRSALITGGGQAAVFLITDDRYTYTAITQCIHKDILELCNLQLLDARTVLKINGVDAREYLQEKKDELGIPETDFEHLTLSDCNHVNAHLSAENTTIKSGRDLHDNMILRYVSHQDVFDTMRKFYDDPEAIVFGCAGLSGILDKPLDTKSLGLFLFGEVCTTDSGAEFGNLMLSKLRISSK